MVSLCEIVWADKFGFGNWSRSSYFSGKPYSINLGFPSEFYDSCIML